MQKSIGRFEILSYSALRVCSGHVGGASEVAAIMKSTYYMQKLIGKNVEKNFQCIKVLKNA